MVAPISIPIMMEYRRLGKTEVMVSSIGLGTEYLIDLPQEHVSGVIHLAIEAGVNFFDVFWAKPEFRDIMGIAFDGYRDKVLLAAHLGSGHIDGQYQAIRDTESCAAFFDDFLKRYKTEYADFLFLHDSDGREDYEEIMKPRGLKDLALEYKEAGKTRFIGFSGHTVETSLDAVRSGAIDVLMFPVNIAGNAVEGKQELLRACVEHDVGLVAMKVFAGGKLLGEWDTTEMNRNQLGGAEMTVDRSTVLTPAKGIHYALSQIGVSTVIPGCKNTQELETDLHYLAATGEERDYADVVADIKQFERGECVYCNHCLPCPQEINIGATIRILETSDRADAGNSERYKSLPNPASACIECGDCETRCPFGVEVIPKMRQAAALYES
jgi:uncharacterized protein